MSKSIRDLPVAAEPVGGEEHWAHKVDSGGYSQIIADTWAAKWKRDGDKPHAVEGTRFRASMAGNCLRQLGYYAIGAEVSDPPTPADLYRMNVGTMLHEILQAVAFEGAQMEVPFEIPAISLSGSADVWYPDSKTVIEVKSAGGFPFKKIGVFNIAEGPKDNHLRQVALAAHALGAETIVVLYIGLETVNRGDMEKYGLTDQQRWLAEYVYSYEDLKPLALKEIGRISAATAVLDAGSLPERHMPDMPDGATINKPKPNSGKPTWTVVEDGVVTDTGTHWACDYCRYQTLCQDNLNEEQS